MQAFTNISESTSLQASLALLLNNDRTAMSSSSGTAFPTQNLEVGMLCFRTDQGRMFILKRVTPSVLWEPLVDSGGGSLAGDLTLTGALTVSGAAFFTNTLNLDSDTSIKWTAATQHKRFINHGAFSHDGASINGTLKVTLPVGRDLSMLTMKVRIYNGGSSPSVTELLIGGYLFSSSWQMTYAGANTTAAVGNSVRFAFDGTRTCILIGTPSSNWAYPKVIVSDVQVGYTGAANSAWDTQIGIGLITNEAGITIDETKTLTQQTVFATQFAPGTLAAAGLSVSNNPETGFGQLSGTNSLAAIVGGRIGWDITAQRNMGLGKSAEGLARVELIESLGIFNSLDNALEGMVSVAAGGMSIGNVRARTLSLITNNATRIQIDANGRIGIGNGGFLDQNFSSTMSGSVKLGNAMTVGGSGTNVARDFDFLGTNFRTTTTPGRYLFDVPGNGASAIHFDGPLTRFWSSRTGTGAAGRVISWFQSGFFDTEGSLNLVGGKYGYIFNQDGPSWVAAQRISEGAGIGFNSGSGSGILMGAFQGAMHWAYTGQEYSTSEFNQGWIALTLNASGWLIARLRVQAPEVLATSDVNTKENIQTVSNALTRVRSLRGVSFNRKIDGAASYGLIAQEVQPHFPELIVRDNDKHLALSYMGLFGPFVEAIKELADRVEALEAA